MKGGNGELFWKPLRCTVPACVVTKSNLYQICSCYSTGSVIEKFHSLIIEKIKHIHWYLKKPSVFIATAMKRIVGLVPMYTLYFLYDRAANFLYDQAGTVKGTNLI